MHPDVASFLKAHLRETLAKKKLQMLRDPFGPIELDEEGFPINQNAERQRAVATMIGHMQSSLRTRSIEDAMPAARMFAEAHGLPRDADNMAELSLGLVQVSLQMFEQESEWLTNGMIARISTEPLDHPPSVRPPPEPVARQGQKLSEALVAFTEFMESTGSWKGQTLAQSNATFRMFIDCNGDLPVETYDKNHTKRFYDLLRELPTNYSRPSKWKTLPLAEIVSATKGLPMERLTMKTTKRHFSALGTFFQHVRSRGEYTGDNPAHGFFFPSPKKKVGRQDWNGENLRKLFASPVWTGCQSASRRGNAGSCIIKDERYWLPILGLYHGNRLEEFAQLRREDIQQQDGIWFFKIHDGGGRQTKNEQSNRRVPLHPELQRLGFLDFVNAVAKTPVSLIFQNLKPGGSDKKLGTYFSKWFGTYRKRIGFAEKLLDYHSFRHTVTTKLYAANVQEAVIDSLVGHERKGTSASVYLHELPLATLLEALSQVTYAEVSLRA